MKKSLVLLVCMGALALGANAQTGDTAGQTVAKNARYVGSTPFKHLPPQAKGADMIRKVGANAVSVPPNARGKIGPITRK